MSIEITRGVTDAVIDQMVSVLPRYEADHPLARIAIYRQNKVSVRVRIIDPDFDGQIKVERSKDVWNYRNALDDEVQADLDTLILLAPGEMQMSFANFELDDPVPSGL